MTLCEASAAQTSKAELASSVALHLVWFVLVVSLLFTLKNPL